MRSESGRWRPDRVAGRALSPRAFRALGIEAVVLGDASAQEGLSRREGVALWRRLPEHGAVFDRVAESGAPGTAVAGAPARPRDRAAPGPTLAVRVVVATTPWRERALRVPAFGARAARALELAGGRDTLPPAPGWLLLVDEGPGDTWLYLSDEPDPGAALTGFLGRRGRTDFARARRRSRLGGVGSLGVFVGLLLAFYAPALGLDTPGQLLGAALIAACLALLVAVRPR